MDASSMAKPNRLSSYLLFAVVALAPLPFGSTEPATIAVWCLVLGFSLIISSPRSSQGRNLLLLFAAAIIVAAYALVIHEQVSASPLLGSPNAAWSQAAEALGIQLASQISIARNEPFFAIGAPLANLLAGVCSYIVCEDRYRARQLFLVVAWSGLVYAVYGIVAFLIDPALVLWREKVAYRDVLTATFVNRNTAAVYFGSCSVVWSLLLCQQIRRHFLSSDVDRRALLHFALNEPPPAVLLPLLMLVPCLAAMLMTNSRAGVVFSLAAVVFACIAFWRRYLDRRTSLVIFVGVGIVSIVVLLGVLGGGVSGRFDVEGLSGEGRIETYRSTLRLIADHPWFGSGLGTFAWSFPAYRSQAISMWGIWTRAHSTPLELAAEVGLPLTAIVGLAWTTALILLARGTIIRQRDRVLPIGALAVAIIALGHSTIDFSLQISGYSIIVFALAGAGIANAFSSRGVSDISIS